MNNKKLKLLTLSTVFALSGCQFSIVDSSSNSGTSNPSSSVTLKEYTVTWVVDGENTQETYLEGEMPVYKYSLGHQQTFVCCLPIILGFQLVR